jgi:hypothetical protein
VQVSCYDKCGYPTSAKAWGCWRHLPRPGKASCSPPAVPLLRVRVFRYSSCVLSQSVSTCRIAGPGVIFLRAGALQASFVLLHPCLRILLAMYSEATACIRQLMCTAVSQLRSAQIIPLHHYAYLLYPACRLVFLYDIIGGWRLHNYERRHNYFLQCVLCCVNLTNVCSADCNIPSLH